MISLRNCPPEFYNNCSLSGVSCNQCVAGSGHTKKLLYVPLDLDLVEHPCKPDNKRSKIVRRAQHTERAVAEEIVKGTLRSGAAFGDGDHLIKGSIRQEVKDRGSRSSWNLTWAEYDKGRRQGIEVYAISVLCPDGKRRTMYMLEPALFTTFLAALDKEPAVQENKP